MQFPELACSSLSLHEVSLACMQFLSLSEQLTRISLACFCSMGREDHPETFLLKVLLCQSATSWLKVMGGGQWVAYTVISWDWG